MTIGVWLMAGPLAGVLLQKFGATTIGEVAAVSLRCCSSQAGVPQR